MTLESQYDGTCPVCNNSFKKGDQIHLQKGKDGKWIKCKDEECFKQQGGEIKEKSQGNRFPSSKFPISEATKLYQLAEEFLNAFEKKYNVNYNPTPSAATMTSLTAPPILPFVPMSIDQKAQFLESFFKTLSGSYKP